MSYGCTVIELVIIWSMVSSKIKNDGVMDYVKLLSIHRFSEWESAIF